MAMEIEKKVLTKIAKENGGVIKVTDVLAEARKEDSVLHKYFEWDDTEAAEKYRREQARALIQRCRIQLVETEPVQIRAFVSLPNDREHGGGYRLMSEVVSDDTLKAELVRDIQLTISRWTQKLHLLDQDLATLLVQLEERVSAKPIKAERVAAGA